jgi:hypothetical protein
MPTKVRRVAILAEWFFKEGPLGGRLSLPIVIQRGPDTLYPALDHDMSRPPTVVIRSPRRRGQPRALASYPRTTHVGTQCLSAVHGYEDLSLVVRRWRMRRPARKQPSATPGGPARRFARYLPPLARGPRAL